MIVKLHGYILLKIWKFWLLNILINMVVIGDLLRRIFELLITLRKNIDHRILKIIIHLSSSPLLLLKF